MTSLLVVQTALVTQETDHSGGARDRSPQGQRVACRPFQQEGVDVLAIAVLLHGVPVVSRHVKWVRPSPLNTHANISISKFKMTDLGKHAKL